jgi:TatD DNase family protein
VYIDSHCHLDFSCFDHDRGHVINTCQSLGVTTIVLPGTQAKSWQKQVSLCHEFPQLRFALGLHPYFLENYQPDQMCMLEVLLRQNRNRVVALGEIGLDSVIDVDWPTQVEVFEQQLDMAQTFELPVILHHRQSHNELIRLMKTHKFSTGGIVHAFSGSLQQAHSYIDMGFKIGVGGGITYARANKTKEAIKQLPLTSLVLETDAPDMPLMGRQGQRNSPEYLPEIFDSLLAIRKESKEVLLQACRLNVQAILSNCQDGLE